MVKTIVFGIFIYLGSHLAYSQVTEGFQCRIKTGFLAAHRGVLSHLPQDIAFATELSYYKHLKRKGSWAEKYNYPTVGATLFVGSVGSNQLLGYYTALYGFADIPLFVKNNFELSWKFGSGLGFTSRIYDPILNPKNMAISTHINSMMTMGIQSKFRFEMNTLSVGLDLTHFSNSGYSMPNFGINIPYLSITYARQLNMVGTMNREENINEFKRLYYGLYGFFSIKEVNADANKKYPVYAAGFFGRYFFQQKAGIEMGIDVVSNQSLFAYEPQLEKNQASILQLGIYSGYLVPLNHFHFFFGMGAYIRDRFQPNGPFYHRIGFRYQFVNGLYGNITLKTHWGKADYMETGLGYVFNFKKAAN
jgi:hypothetical protein